jgi:capsule polysaccharide export protein KpsC/LpsZ
MTFRKIQADTALQEKLCECTCYIDCDNALNTFQLIGLAKLVVAVSSQSGLESALFGKPVVVAGSASYSGHGFAYDVLSPRLMTTQLDLAYSNRGVNHSHEASKFACIYFAKDCLSKIEESLAQLLDESFA